MVETVDIPSIIDIESPLQFEIEARLPSSCFVLKPTTLRYDHDRHVIFFHASALKSEVTCDEQPTIARQQIVSTARLQQGTYEIRELKSLKKWGLVQVERFSASAESALKSITPFDK